MLVWGFGNQGELLAQSVYTACFQSQMRCFNVLDPSHRQSTVV